MPKVRFQCIVAVHLFFIRNNTILLLRRQNTGFCDGMFSVVAGHIEGNENVIESMIREAKEEVGVLINKRDLHFVQVMHRKKENEERIDFFFECKKWRGKIKINEPEKCNELRWVRLKNLPQDMVPYVYFAITQYLKGNLTTLFGWK